MKSLYLTKEAGGCTFTSQNDRNKNLQGTNTVRKALAPILNNSISLSVRSSSQQWHTFS